MIRRQLVGVLIGATVALALAPSAAQAAPIPIEEFKTSSADPQAGGHPDLVTEFKLGEPDKQAAKTVTFEAPEGIFGNPNAVTRCTSADFALSECPVNSQIGVITVWAYYNGNKEYLLGTAPLYDMAPSADEAARFQLVTPVVNIPIAIPVSVRTGSDWGLRFSVTEISQQTPLRKVKMSFWGVPLGAAHNTERFQKGSPGNPPGCTEEEHAFECISTPGEISEVPQPLIDNPTLCTEEALPTELIVQSYQHPDESSAVAKSQYAAIEGCEAEAFNPVLSASLTTSDTDTASGLNLGFKVPQKLELSPTPSELRTATVVLPEGLTINPDAADGQTACQDSEANFGSDAAANCPDKSKIGTVTIGTPALDAPLRGSLYIGEPKPDNQYRVFMAFSGSGINGKLVGKFLPDPETGRLTATFEDLPQVPFEEFDLHLFASDRGLMATPTTCTLFSARAHFTPWNDILSAQDSEQFFGLDSGPGGTSCPGPVRPFVPRLVAGSANAVAGAFSAFHLKLDRDDGDQFLGDLNFRMPPGFTGNLRGISYCPESAIAAAAQRSGKAEQASPSCPSSSEVGTSNVAAGPGSHPFHAVGKLYLAGPLNGAPLSLVAITPAIAGPYDYGNVVVRVALKVNPLTAQVSAESEKMPQIIGGIPIRMRSIQVNIDRPNFTINPTNCSIFSVDSQGVGDQGTVTDFSSYFHAVNCAHLGFEPKMRIRLVGGKKQTRRGQNPALRFDLWTREGDANLKRLAVTLPKAFAIDQRHLGNICSRAELASTRCAGRQQIGRVRVDTPLLDQPLTGPAYAVSGFGKLPHVIFILDGQVTIMPEAESSSVGGGFLKTVVPVIPDAPVGHFRFDLFGGKQGYLINTRSTCSEPVVRIQYVAQSDRRHSQRVNVGTKCGKKARRAASHGRG
ncbi:MAG TPA: hypothetical protein VH476_07325 [Solirubrobacterales bacterium]|jgi:hypothetical protein